MAARLSPARKASARNPSGAPPRAANPGDNAKALEEAERVQLISFVSKLSDAEGAIELAKAPLKAAQKARSSIINLAKAAGFTAKELERRMEEMNRPVFENAQQAVREARHRRWLGIVTPEQQEMHLGDSTPQEAKDEADHESEGYRAGLRGHVAKPPEKVPARFVQAWMKGHEAGFKSQTEAMLAIAPKPLSGPAAVGAKAAKDFADDNPELDVAKAARKLKADAKFMDRSPPPEDDGKPTAPAGEEPFEATPEELAAQTGRAQSEDVV